MQAISARVVLYTQNVNSALVNEGKIKERSCYLMYMLVCFILFRELHSKGVYADTSLRFRVNDASILQ